MAFRRFMPLNTQPSHVYVDRAQELLKALRELKWNHDTPTPHRPETNGVIERAVRRVKEGTSATLLQSGLTEVWWQEAMDCYCFLRCVHDKVAGNQTAFERRFQAPFKGPIIPFGAQITYKPSDPNWIKKLHQFGKKMMAGIFLGYAQHTGGGWTGDLLIADWQQVENAIRDTQIHLKRFKAGEVDVVQRYGDFCFPVAEGDLRVQGDSLEALINRVGHAVYYKKSKEAICKKRIRSGWNLTS